MATVLRGKRGRYQRDGPEPRTVAHISSEPERAAQSGEWFGIEGCLTSDECIHSSDEGLQNGQFKRVWEEYDRNEGCAVKRTIHRVVLGGEELNM